MITLEQIHICLYAIDLRNLPLTLVVLLKRCTLLMYFSETRLLVNFISFKSGCQRKPGKMLKMSTEGSQQNKFILTSQIGLVE